jgi:hypothetical protein
MQIESIPLPRRRDYLTLENYIDEVIEKMPKREFKKKEIKRVYSKDDPFGEEIWED